VRWQYRTLLFEFQKDGLLGDKYIDDEEVEELLNEQGASGWELVNVALIQEGLLAFCKRSVPHGIRSVSSDGGQPPHCESETPEESMSAEKIQQLERVHIQNLENQRRKTMSAPEYNVVGDIKIS
jgi:hypothetical protein